jgi:hypothetical protein
MESLVYGVKLQMMEYLTGCILSATVHFKNDGAMLCRAASVFFKESDIVSSKRDWSV